MTTGFRPWSGGALVLLGSLLQAGAYVPFLAAQSDASASSRGRTAWHQHFDLAPLQLATPLTGHPLPGDTVAVRISGVWINRANYNLWTHRRNAFVGTAPCLVHGYIDESSPGNVPRYKFVGKVWRDRADAAVAQAQIRRAFAEWSDLAAGASAATGEPLKTGLEFREVAADSAAEIEIYWRRQRTAATTDRTFFRTGIVGLTRLYFNSSVPWSYGPAAATPPNRMHFYSTALHEVGHLVGLWESTDPRSVMIYQRRPGPDGPSFDALDEASRRAAYALYSMPVDAVSGSGDESCAEAGS